jgi:hypothetical protein
MDRFRILVLSLTAVAIALLCAASALGAIFQSGHYKGTTEQGKAISFQATQGQVKKMSFTAIAVCASGYGSRGSFSNIHVPIRNTRFEVKLTGDEGATTVVVKGRLVGPYAGGTIVDRTRVNPEKEGKPEADGTDRCKATFHWAAEIG